MDDVGKGTQPDAAVPEHEALGMAGGYWGLLSGSERAALSKLGPTIDFQPGTTMLREGDPAAHLYIVVSGWVKIFSATVDGRQIVLALRGKGDVVGEIGGELTGRRNATIQAIDLVRALVVGYDRFIAFLDTNPGADTAYRRTVTQRWSYGEALLRRHSMTSGEQRLAALLLEIAGHHGSEAKGVVEIAMPLSQEELASLAGTSRATVSRALRNWRSRAIVRTGPKRVMISNPAGLRQIAGYR